MTTAQLAGLTRLDLPLVLGKLVTEDPDRARLAGFVIHLGFGQVFALGYALVFALLHRTTWWLGGVLGLVHVAVVLLQCFPDCIHGWPRTGRAPQAGRCSNHRACWR